MSPNKIAVFIDGPHLHIATKALGWQVDFERFKKHFLKNQNVLRLHYYTASRVETTGEGKTEKMRPLLDWLEFNGFVVRSRHYSDFDKNSMAVDIAVDMLQLGPHVDRMAIFSGDGSLRPAVEAVQRLGVRVEVFSTIQTNPVMISEDLRRPADTFGDLCHWEKVIAKETDDSPRETLRHTLRAGGNR
jgi:uncharacterized LabA/DUF88 family protein